MLEWSNCNGLIQFVATELFHHVTCPALRWDVICQHIYAMCRSDFFAHKCSAACYLTFACNFHMSSEVCDCFLAGSRMPTLPVTNSRINFGFSEERPWTRRWVSCKNSYWFVISFYEALGATNSFTTSLVEETLISLSEKSVTCVERIAW